MILHPLATFSLILKHIHTLIHAAKTKSSLFFLEGWGGFCTSRAFCLGSLFKHDMSRSIETCGGTEMWRSTRPSRSARQKRSPSPGWGRWGGGATQIDAALNEQRIMLATSVERALKNSCFVSGMAVVRLCIHWIIYQASQPDWGIESLLA